MPWDREVVLASVGKTRRAELVKRLGVAGVVFFLVKGLVWLALPMVMYLGREGR